MPAQSNHPVFEAPSDTSIKLWRYMDFTKFVSLLDSNSLFFSRADLLGDPYEGSTSHFNQAAWPNVYKNDILVATLQATSNHNEWQRQWTKAGPLMHAVRQLVGRSLPTAREVRMLHGVARQLLWAAKHLPPKNDPAG